MLALLKVRNLLLGMGDDNFWVSRFVVCCGYSSFHSMGHRLTLELHLWVDRRSCDLDLWARSVGRPESDHPRLKIFNFFLKHPIFKGSPAQHWFHHPGLWRSPYIHFLLGRLFLTSGRLRILVLRPGFNFLALAGLLVWRRVSYRILLGFRSIFSLHHIGLAFVILHSLSWPFQGKVAFATLILHDFYRLLDILSAWLPGEANWVARLTFNCAVDYRSAWLLNDRTVLLRAPLIYASVRDSNDLGKRRLRLRVLACAWQLMIITLPKNCWTS